QVILGDGTQHVGLVGAADEDLADELARVNRLLGGEAMVARHQDDERLPVHHVVPEVVARLHAHEGQVQPAASCRTTTPRSTATGRVARAIPTAAMLHGAAGSVLSRTSPLSGFVSWR